MANEKILFVPRIDGEPHRAWSSINVRREDKDVLDYMQWWWSREFGISLSQWDCFSILLAYYLEHERSRLPPDMVRELTSSKA